MSVDAINATPHDLVIYGHGGFKKLITIPSMGQIRLRPDPDNAPTILELTPRIWIPAHQPPKWVGLDDPHDLLQLPETRILVVSGLVGEYLAKTRRNVYSPDTGPGSVIRDERGRILGVRSLIKYS